MFIRILGLQKRPINYLSSLKNFHIDSIRMSSTFLEAKSHLRDIFNAGVNSVLPQNLIKNKVKIVEDQLQIGNDNYKISESVYLVGFGKAVMGMAIAVEEILGHRLKKGIISIPKGSKNDIWKTENLTSFPKLSGVIEYREGALHNQPDKDCLETTHDILDLAEGLNENDTLIVLISGGGSALLFMPRPSISSEDKQEFCKNLQNAGASITELNTIRKKLSMVKGGGLAKIAFPASVISLIISDIIGDPVDLIASGPTVYSSKPSEEVTAILKKYDLFKNLEGSLKSLMTSKEPKEDKNLLDRKKQFKHVQNVIIANNSIAMEAAKQESLKKNLSPIILSNEVKGEVHDMSVAYAQITFLICLALEKSIDRTELYEKMKYDHLFPLNVERVNKIFDTLEDSTQGIILIGGGEPIVKVTGSGKGGRNQELALYFSLEWLMRVKSHPNLTKYEVLILSGGTDGQDGPTDAAGAFGYPAIAPIIHNLKKKVQRMQMMKNISVEDLNSPSANSDLKEVNLDLILKEIEHLLPENVLKANDTYNFYSRFKKGVDLVKTGLTGTNVMDLHLIYIKKRQCACSIDFDKGSKFPDSLDEHDLHRSLDPGEMEKEDESFVKELELLNIKITDKNFESPCCSRKGKILK